MRKCYLKINGECVEVEAMDITINEMVESRATGQTEVVVEINDERLNLSVDDLRED